MIMKTIYVEGRKDNFIKHIMNEIADECERLGHTVERCYPFSHYRRPPPEGLKKSDLIIVWNGIHPHYRQYQECIQEHGIKTLYAELGWFPQRKTFQIDPTGFNAAASWASEPLKSKGKERIAIPSEGDLLVILQLDIDTQIRYHSPYFENMTEFVKFLADISPMKLRVRRHPRHAPSAGVRRIVNEHPNCYWDDSKLLPEALDKSCAVAMINSSSGIEALMRGAPILCFGNAVYRHPGVVVCCDNRPKATRKAIESIHKAGIWKQRVNEFLARIMTKQWTIEDIPTRLGPFLDQVLK